MATPTKLRSLYRSFLRELPSRPLSSSSSSSSSLKSSRTPLQHRIRETITSPPQSQHSTATRASITQADQYLQYVKAQRMYATLLERYNPGMGMDEEERVRLTARRVGMDLPVEFSYAGMEGRDDGGDGRRD